MQDEATKLWQSRGIFWNEQNCCEASLDLNMKIHLTHSGSDCTKVHLIDTSKGKTTNGESIRVLIPEGGIDSTLWSFAYKTKRNYDQWVQCWQKTKALGSPVRVILDSGAFTAWSSGKEVNIDEYARWALEISKSFPFDSIRFINLDHIPGSKGRSATPDELKFAAYQSMRNADTLRAIGLNPVVEVFHQDEPFELLKRINERRNGEIIALSPRNDVSVQKREE